MGKALRKALFFLLLIGLLSLSTGLVYLLLSGGKTVTAFQVPGQSLHVRKTAITHVPTPSVTPTLPVVAQKPCEAKERSYEMGIAFPQWSPQAYGGTDANWMTELPRLKSQTAACWVEMPVLLFQSSPSSTVVTAGPSTPTTDAVNYGIRYAHSLGLHVFVTILMGVDGGANNWAGSIKFTNLQDEQAWFTSYWHAVQPYAAIAQQAGAEQFGVATEEEWLQSNAPNAYWSTLITSVHGVFSGPLVYDMNWTSLGKLVPEWMFNPLLKMIGVSAYLPSVATSERLTEAQIAALWQSQALPKLDHFASTMGKPIFLSEIGYRNSADALYKTWVANSSAPADPAEQAAACQAALEAILSDEHIIGNFFWGWDNAGAFNLKDSPAAKTIQHYYQSAQK